MYTHICTHMRASPSPGPSAPPEAIAPHPYFGHSVWPASSIAHRLRVTSAASN